MKVKDLIQILSKLDWEREIQIGEYQKNLNAYYFKNGCTIHEEYVTKNFVLLPNNSDIVKFSDRERVDNSMSKNPCTDCKYNYCGKCHFRMDIHMDGIPISLLKKCPKK